MSSSSSLVMKKVAIILYWLLFVVPPIVYLTTNFYWWLFDGNVLSVEKMGGAVMALGLTFVPGLYFVIERWER